MSEASQRAREEKGYKCTESKETGKRCVFMCEGVGQWYRPFNERNEWYILHYPVTAVLLDATLSPLPSGCIRSPWGGYKYKHANISRGSHIHTCCSHTYIWNLTQWGCILHSNQHSSAHKRRMNWCIHHYCQPRRREESSEREKSDENRMKMRNGGGKTKQKRKKTWIK